MATPAHLLVIEDEPDSAAVIEMILNGGGILTDVATSAEEALDILNETDVEYDALIVDLALPEMDGFEFLEVIRYESTFKALMLIAVTAYHTPELRVKALDAGFDAYIPKPLDTNTFLSDIQRILDQ